MGSCNDQHHCAWSYCLYIYSRCWSVRNDCNDDDYCGNTDHSDICSDRTTLPELCCSGSAWNFYRRDHRYLGSCNDQHHCAWSDNIYIYTGCWSVRNNCNDDDYRSYADHADICSDRTTLPELCCTCSAWNFY